MGSQDNEVSKRGNLSVTSGMLPPEEIEDLRRDGKKATVRAMSAFAQRANGNDFAAEANERRTARPVKIATAIVGALFALYVGALILRLLGY